MSDELTPITRKETFLAKAGGQNVVTPTPITREETFLQAIIDNGGGGGGTGGGVTIIHASGSPLTLDKTYAEIYSALQSEIVMMPMEFMGMFATGLCCVAGEYDGAFVVGVYNLAAGEMSRFAAATQSDYPVVTE